MTNKTDFDEVEALMKAWHRAAQALDANDNVVLTAICSLAGSALVSVGVKEKRAQKAIIEIRDIVAKYMEEELQNDE